MAKITLKSGKTIITDTKASTVIKQIKANDLITVKNISIVDTGKVTIVTKNIETIKD